MTKEYTNEQKLVEKITIKSIETQMLNDNLESFRLFEDGFRYKLLNKKEVTTYFKEQDNTSTCVCYMGKDGKYFRSEYEFYHPNPSIEFMENLKRLFLYWQKIIDLENNIEYYKENRMPSTSRNISY